MSKLKNSYSFLIVGSSNESTETVEFKKYVGIGSSFVKAVNPTKKELDTIFGYDAKEPEYVKDTDNGKEAYITFIVKTDPSQCNEIEITNRLTFTLRLTPDYNKDQTKVRVIDQFGNFTWVNTEDAKSGAAITGHKLDTKYRMACVGECDLVSFLKAYLCVPEAFNYVNGEWVKKDNAKECLFGLEHIKDYFNGDVTELKQAIAMQSNNKVKLLYGVRTTEEGKQYQAISSRADLILRNAAGANALTKLEKKLANIKENGSYANTDFRVCELQEWTIEPTNLDKAPESSDSSSEMPWD